MGVAGPHTAGVTWAPRIGACIAQEVAETSITNRAGSSRRAGSIFPPSWPLLLAAATSVWGRAGAVHPGLILVQVGAQVGGSDVAGMLVDVVGHLAVRPQTVIAPGWMIADGRPHQDHALRVRSLVPKLGGLVLILEPMPGTSTTTRTHRRASAGPITLSMAGLPRLPRRVTLLSPPPDRLRRPCSR
jgi:hypothetical protein